MTGNFPSGKIEHLERLIENTNAKLRKHGYEEITLGIKP